MGDLCKFLSFQGNLPDDWVRKAEELVAEKQESRHAIVCNLKEVIGKDEMLQKVQSDLDEKKLTKFLRAGNWDVSSAAELLRSYLDLGRQFPECIEASLPSQQRRVWAQKLLSCKPVRDSRGRRILILHRIGNWDPASISPNEYLAGALSLLEMLSQEPITQIAGLTVVLNADGFSFKHLRYFGLHPIKCLASFLNGAVPLWFRSFHIVNHPRVFHMFFSLIKPLLNERIKDNIVFHSDLNSLHEWEDVQLLPSELGGNSTENNIDDTFEAVKSLEEEIQKNIEMWRKIRLH